MDNPETLGTPGTQLDTGRIQTKQKTTQKTKKMSNTDHHNTRGEFMSAC